MNIYVGQCPYCDVRLLVDIEDYYDIEVDDCGILELTYNVQCWKCDKISQSIIAQNIETEVVEQTGLEGTEDLHSCIPITQAKQFSTYLTDAIKIKKDE
jgi:hypothetical protein